MTMTNDVTVVVPTRNRRDLLRATLRSIRGQESVGVRIVVVDEASTDGTIEWLERIGDARLRVVRHDEPRGVAAARNTGLAAVDTRWVAFCDDDDLWAPDKVASQLAALEADAARWCCGGSVMVDGDLGIVDHQRAITGDVLDALLAMNRVPGGGSGVLAETAFVREVGGFDVSLRNSEDWDLWIRLAQRSRLAGVDRPLVAYRMWAGSKSRDLSRMLLAWQTITTRYRELAAARGVEADVARHREYLARQQVRDRRRMTAARTYSRMAFAAKDPKAWPRAVAALVAPAFMDRVGTERASRRVPPEWRAEGDAWLAAHRSSDVIGSVP